MDGRVVERGAHHQVWELPVQRGEPSRPPRRVVELQTGMNRWNQAAGEWEAAPERINLFAGGAIANYGQYDVEFADNLNVQDPIKIRLPDGNAIKAGVLALAYRHVDDYVVIANIQDCVGDVAGNEVTYRNVVAEGGGDGKYILTKASCEQFVIIREQLPPPAAFGLPYNSVLEVVTAFDGVAPHRVSKEVLRPEVAAGAGNVGVPSLVDEHLDFGSMLMPTEQRFPQEAIPSQAPALLKIGSHYGGDGRWSSSWNMRNLKKCHVPCRGIATRRRRRCNPEKTVTPSSACCGNLRAESLSGK